MPEIPVLYEDNSILAVDKPRGIHVHPTRLSRREISLQDLVQEEYGFPLYPVHRLDRAVGGVLLLTKSREAAGVLGGYLRRREGVEKTYICIVRGWLHGQGKIDRPLKQSADKPEQEALTYWRALAQTEAAWTDGIFPASRYTLLECKPETGRYHQIRRHLARISHPIPGDTAHGDNRRNHIWHKQTGLDGLMLHARRLSFIHPDTEKWISIEASPDPRFLAVSRMFGWEILKEGNNEPS